MQIIVMYDDRSPIEDYPNVYQITMKASDDETAIGVAHLFYRLMKAMDYDPVCVQEAFEAVAEEHQRKD